MLAFEIQLYMCNTFPRCFSLFLLRASPVPPPGLQSVLPVCQFLFFSCNKTCETDLAASQEENLCKPFCFCLLLLPFCSCLLPLLLLLHVSPCLCKYCILMHHTHMQVGSIHELRAHRVGFDDASLACERRFWCSCRVLGVQVAQENRRNILADLLTVYANAGKTIVFTQTKREADEVAAGIAGVIPSEVASLRLLHALSISREVCSSS